MKKNLSFALLTVLIWSTTAPLVKALLSNLPNLEALSVSSFLAALFLIGLNAKKGKLRRIGTYGARQLGAMAGLGFVGLFLYSALYYYGLTVLTAQEACILNYLWPIMIVIFSVPLLGERLTGMKCAAILCSFVGIIILSTGGGTGSTGNRTAGILCCIAAAVCYGLFSALNKRLDMDQDMTMLLVWLVTAVCSAIAGLCTEQWVVPQGIQWLGILWLGVVVDAVAYLLWALALRGAENTAAIANLAYLTPFLAVVLSAVFLGEPIQGRAVIALIFIVGGILLQQLFANRTKQ